MRGSCALVFALLWGFAASTPAAPSLETLVGEAEFDNLQISPTGRQLALIQRVDGRQGVRVLEFPSLNPVGAIQFGQDIGVDDVHWVDDQHLLVEPLRLFPGFTRFKARTGEIVRIDVPSMRTELIFGFQAGRQQTGTRVPQRQSLQAAGELIPMDTGVPGEVLIRTIDFSQDGQNLNDVYRLDIDSGRLRRVAGSPVRNGRFVMSEQGEVLLAYGVDLQNEIRVFQRTGNRGEWAQRAAGQGGGSLVPLAPAGGDNGFLALDDRDGGTAGVVRWDVVSGATTPLFRHAAGDLRVAGRDRRGNPWAFEIVDHYPGYWYPDPEHPLARMHAALVRRLPDHHVRVTSLTADGSTATVRVSNARRPPVFLVVRVRDAEAVLVMQAYPRIKPDELSPVDAIEFKAADGLPIRAYLTTPRTPDGKPGRRLPMVVLPHGGPHGVADDYDWDFERQLLAANGYAVLQVNFRGSGGRGPAFEHAGYGKWGREMQDDITAGVRWAIADGVADPGRLCIYGGSYGAYAALTGAFRDPELYRCAIGMAGVYDLPLLFERGDIQTMARGVNYLKAAVGTDVASLADRSPVQHAREIRAKVMLLHGKEDPRAPIQHAERMRRALTDAGNPPEWIVESGEMHGFFNAENRTGAYRAILSFLARHLGP